MIRAPRAQPLGDSAITVSFGTERSAELLKVVHSAAASIAAAGIPEVEDIVPAYLGVAVFYDPLRVSSSEMMSRLLAVCDSAASATPAAGANREHHIRVTYDGPDLDHVSASTGLSVDEVIARHTGRSYSVDLLGFVPGFAYLSEIDPALQLERRPQPRPRVPAGSVAIAGAQTAVYPLDTPGGWHIIGRTGTVMFDPLRDPPALLRAGDIVRFVSEQ